MPRRTALHVSIAVIAGLWAWQVVRHVALPDADAAPESVAEIARFVAVNTAIRLAVIAALLRWSGEGPAGIGLRRQGLGGQILRGAGLGALVFVVAHVVVSPAVRAVLPEADDGGMIGHLFTDLRELPLWLFCGVVGGGVSEELSRAFVLTRFERLAGRRGLVVALAIDTVMFGMGHLYQGVPGALTAGFSGLANAFIFLRRRSVLEAISAHALFDAVGISLAYIFAAHA